MKVIKSKCCNSKVIIHGFDIINLITRNYHFECKKCKKLFELLINKG